MKYLRFLISCILGWWPMMAVHEFGHVVGCMFSGAKVEQVILWPWTISQTIRSESQAPLIDTWFGPVLGGVIPALAYLLVSNKQFLGRDFLGFFAGFCLIANGAYIGTGWMDHAGDAGDLIRLGCPLYILIIFGIISCGCGLLIWNKELFKKQ